MSTLIKQTASEVARPLKVLVPLIKSDIERGEHAGVTFFTAAGEKLNEAREGHFEGNTSGFFKWAEKTFGKKRTQLGTWMALGRTTSRKPFKSLRHFEQTPKKRGGLGYGERKSEVFRSWTAPVDAVAERARAEQLRLQREDDMTRAQERDAETRLGLKLIDIGYKVLARELHPDSGGSREAMARLNRVRDRLKASV